MNGKGTAHALTSNGNRHPRVELANPLIYIQQIVKDDVVIRDIPLDAPRKAMPPQIYCINHNVVWHQMVREHNPRFRVAMHAMDA